MPLESLIGALTTANRALAAATAAKRLADGITATDDAVRYLRGEGAPHVATVLDSLAPGLGGLVTTTNASVDALGHALTTIEGEYRVLDDEEDGEPVPALPWARFARHWQRQKSGASLLLGPRGSGKTSLLNHLAARAQQHHAFAIEYVAIYSDDRLLPGTEVPMEKIATRVARIILSLNPKAADEAPDDASDPDGTVSREASTQWRKFLARVRGRFGVESIHELRRTFGGKIILIDEAGADVLGGAPNDPYRQAVFRSLDQCRHVDWIILMATQRARSVPKEPFNASTILVKQPSGEEWAMDTGQNRFLREMWEQAIAAFKEIRRSPYYRDYPDPRAWAWIRSPSRDRWSGWTGMAPFDYSEFRRAA